MGLTSQTLKVRLFSARKRVEHEHRRMIATESTNKMDIMDKIVVTAITITVDIQITMEDIQIMVGIPTIMEGTITIMADTQITTEATQIMEAIQVMAMEDTQTIIMVGTQIIMEVIQTIMEDIQVMVTGVTQAMVMEDIQTTIKIMGTLETVSELLEAIK